MYFSFGSHPALALNFGGQNIGDYFLRVFREDGPLKRQTIEKGGLIYTNAGIGDDGKGDSFDIQLADDSFDKDALVFTNTKISKIELRSHSSEKYISFDTGKTPDLGIWSKPGAAYVCLEPWYGYDDPASHSGNLTTKPGIQLLNPKEEFRTSYSISPQT